jgi:hypothetical protein
MPFGGADGAMAQSAIPTSPNKRSNIPTSPNKSPRKKTRLRSVLGAKVLLMTPQIIPLMSQMAKRCDKAVS